MLTRRRGLLGSLATTAAWPAVGHARPMGGRRSDELTADWLGEAAAYFAEPAVCAARRLSISI